MKKWKYKKKVIDSIEDILAIEPTAIGFVYKITNDINGKFYIGKKNLYSNRNKKITKKEIAATKTRKRKITVTKESNWKSYYGSSAELHKDVITHGKNNFTREIIEFCHSAKTLSYCEVKWQFQLEVLVKNTYNGNILGRYYRKDANPIMFTNEKNQSDLQ